MEVDGPIHESRHEEDKIREIFIKSHDLRLLRFSNEDILNDLDSVLKVISLTLASRPQFAEK